MTNPTKILLILPPAYLFPLGAAYVAATLEHARYGYDVYGFFYDYRAWFTRTRVNAENTYVREPVRNISSLKSHDTLFELIARENYTHILVGGLVGFFRWFYQVLPQVKGYNPHSTLIMGGGITKDLPPNTIFEKLNTDYILKGEAETNLIELLTLLSQPNPNPADFFRIPGLCWKDRTSAIRSNATVRFDITQHTMYPAWDSLNINEYIALSDTLFHFNKTFFPILAGRGCPNVCAFCSPSIGHFTPRPVESVISEMKHWVQKYTFDFFLIYSEVAFDDESYTQEFCRQYASELNTSWVGQLRTDVHFSVDTYRQMKQAGCMFIAMGFESSNDRILKRMNKRTTYNDHMRNMNQAKEAGLTVVGNFLFGHETETADEIKETFAFLNQHDLINGHSNGIATIIVYPGTQYYRNAEKRGLINDPLKYLLSYSMKAAPPTADRRRSDTQSQLNISALPDQDFYDVLYTEYVAHRRLYSKRHAALAAQSDFTLSGSAGYIFAAQCPTCKNIVNFPSEAYRGPLNITALCHHCYYTVSIDLYAIPETTRYLALLNASIKNSEKIVVYGTWLMDLLYCGAIDLPLDKVIAWLDPDNPSNSQYSHRCHMPQILSAAHAQQDYDAVLSLRPRAFSTPHILEQHGLNAHSRIINLFPDTLNSVLVSELAGTRVAIVGVSDSAVKTLDLLTTTSTSTLMSYDTIRDIFATEARHDYVVYDNEEFSVTRQEFAQDSQYRMTQVLYTTFLLDGGYYARY